jgi:hypothetical protein
VASAEAGVAVSEALAIARTDAAFNMVDRVMVFPLYDGSKKPSFDQ